MFFRREKPKVWSFTDRLDTLRQAGFTVESAGPGKARAIKGGCAAMIEEGTAERPKIGKAGVVVGNEIAVLVDGGFQKFLQTADGHKYAAQADHLKALHNFQEDMKEALGLTSLYNESLGTTSAAHIYDRVKDRDRGAPRRPWEHEAPSK